MRSIVCLGLAALAATAVPDRALAGAWLQEKGRGQVIATVASARAGEAFDEAGVRVPATPFRADHLDALVEYGWSERVTLRAKLSAGRWRNELGDRGQSAGVQELGGRVALLETGRFVSSLEASLLVAEAHGDDEWRAGFDLRALVGTGFEIFGHAAFAEGQLGLRDAGGPAGPTLAVDATLGVRPWPSTLLLLQSFSLFALSVPEAPLVPFERTRLRASVVYDLGERWSVQAGVEETLAGRGAAAERGLVAALWWRF